MATIGQALTAPEAGWKRIDSEAPFILLTGSIGITNDASAYNGSEKTLGTGSTATATFCFYGSKLRIIGRSYISSGNTGTVTIDGVACGDIQDSKVFQGLYYEKTDLALGIHQVVIAFNRTASAYSFDAIDIDNTGYIAHPVLRTAPKTSLATMKVGDYINCEYTASSGAVGTFANLGSAVKGDIPTTGSATPNGSFYFICVDKNENGGILIADRVIQHSISWDVLNSAGYIEGVPFSLVPPMTADIQNGFTITYSSVYANTSSYGYYAFNGVIDTGSTRYGWGTESGVTSGWIAIEFPNQTIVKAYSIAGQYGYQDRAPKSWTFEGSNNGVDWTILDTQSNISGWTDFAYKKFYFNNSTPYKKYRLNVTENNGSTVCLNIGEIRLFSANAIIRSLYGGVAYSDVYGGFSTIDSGNGSFPSNNEWDKYIINSTLNGKIAKGDDIVWNAKWTKPATWCVETPTINIATSSNRIRTTLISSDVSQQYILSSSATVQTGFRPVLEYKEDGSNLW